MKTGTGRYLAGLNFRLFTIHQHPLIAYRGAYPATVRQLVAVKQTGTPSRYRHRPRKNSTRHTQQELS